MANITTGRGEGIRGNYGGIKAVYFINYGDSNYDSYCRCYNTYRV